MTYRFQERPCLQIVLLLEDGISSVPSMTVYTSRRCTLRYSTTPSPLKKTGTVIKSVSRNLKKMSLRVVNLANMELEGRLRLGDGDADEGNN